MKKSELKSIIKELINEVKTDEHGNHLEPQFKVGDKVTYLRAPGEITGVNTEMGGTYTYNVRYNKGEGYTKATNISNKGGETIKKI